MKMAASWAVAVRGSRGGARARAAAAAAAVCGLVLAGAGGAGSAQAAAKVRPACPAPVVSGATATVTCSFTGAARYWTVPAGVTRATFTLYGAKGGAGGDNYHAGGDGGKGAEVTGTLTVTPGAVLQVNVGRAGESAGGAFGGGGGGGAAAAVPPTSATVPTRSPTGCWWPAGAAAAASTDGVGGAYAAVALAGMLARR